MHLNVMGHRDRKPHEDVALFKQFTNFTRNVCFVFLIWKIFLN